MSLRVFCVSPLCSVVLSHARLWISNGHLASEVVKNQHLTIYKVQLRPRGEPRTRSSETQFFPRTQTDLDSQSCAKWRTSTCPPASIPVIAPAAAGNPLLERRKKSTSSHLNSRVAAKKGCVDRRSRGGHRRRRWVCLRGREMSPEWRSKISLHHFSCRGQRQLVAMFDAARQFVAR
jgi:hypothetical protein